MLSLTSINIEHSKHLPRVQKFLQTRKPDVACFQEACRKDLPFLMEHVGPYLAWAPMTLYPETHGPEPLGLAIISRWPLTGITPIVYKTATPDGALPTYDYSRKGWTGNINWTLLTATVTNGAPFRLATTHFTWTPEGAATEEQLADADLILAETAKEPELILCGDFNAPRGRATFSKFASTYRDNIPAHYTTSLDGTLHRAGPLPYMVDGLFTTPHYTAKDVELHTGVSDHCAITATLHRT